MRKEKTLLLDEIKDKIDGSTAWVVASYDKLEPNKSWQLRELLAKSGGQFEVVRKRVFLKAAEKSGLKLDESLLSGHVCVMFVGQPDAMPSTKAMVTFSEQNANFLKVLCGQIEGKIVAGEEVVVLSKLPGINEMRAILLGLFTSPMAYMLSVLDAKIAENPSENKSES